MGGGMGSTEPNSRAFFKKNIIYNYQTENRIYTETEPRFAKFWIRHCKNVPRAQLRLIFISLNKYCLRLVMSQSITKT